MSPHVQQPRDECAYCGRETAVRIDGKPRRHHDPTAGQSDPWWCPGSDMPAKTLLREFEAWRATRRDASP